MDTVLVTGAAGTVGNYVVALAEAAGYRVIANDRTGQGVRTPVRGEVRPGDLTDPLVAERIVAGCDYVIHTAAQLDAARDEAELSRSNTDAVVYLYEAARRAGVRRFVHTSTGMLYQPGIPGPVPETAPLAPRGVYGMSKLAAETYLRGVSGGPSWTVIRAAPIYGRRGRHFAASLLAVGPILRLSTPVLPRFRGGPRWSMVHAEDVARALLFVLARGDVDSQCLNVADADPLPLGERIAATFEAYRLRSVPAGGLPRLVLEQAGRLFQRPVAHDGAGLVTLAAWQMVVLRHGLKPALRPRLDKEALTLLYDSLVLDTSRLAALGFVPRYPKFAEGFEGVLRWYQAERWVPRFG